MHQYELVVVLYADFPERWPRTPFNKCVKAKYELVFSLITLSYSGDMTNRQPMYKFLVVVCEMAVWNLISANPAELYLHRTSFDRTDAWMDAWT